MQAFIVEMMTTTCSTEADGTLNAYALALVKAKTNINTEVVLKEGSK